MSILAGDPRGDLVDCYGGRKKLNAEKIELVAIKHAAEIGEMVPGIKPERSNSGYPCGRPLRHALWMCGEIINFARAGRIEKACRWLGFVQGVLWATGSKTIKELKCANMPEESEYRLNE